jgi:hypothetical protein
MRVTLIFAIAALVCAAYAYVYVAPIYVGNGAPGCTQTNTTYISCQDGSTITAGIIVSAPSTQLFDNYTVWESGNNNITALSGISGGECVVGYGKSTTCFITIPAFSVFSGNGISQKSITLRLVPSGYPQAAQSENISITINHYLNATVQAALESYESAYSGYILRGNEYAYVCGSYGVCNTTVQQSNEFVNHTLAEARSQLIGNNTAGATLNISFASTELKDSNATFYAFADNANSTVRAVVNGSEDIGIASSEFRNSTKVLSGCLSSNKTSAADYLAPRINESKEMQKPVTLSGAQQYSAYGSGLLKNTTGIIASCSKTNTFAASSGFVLSLPDISLGGSTEYIIIAIVIIIALLYIRSALATRAEMKRIREQEEAPKDAMHQGSTEINKDGSADVETSNVEEDDFVQKISKGGK